VFEGGQSRHILIDVGNVTGTGGSVSVFKPVFDDVIRELDTAPLDLYIMTHEHMDHVKGPLYANDQLGFALKEQLKPRHAWLTASSKSDYYDTHPEAKKKRLEMVEALQAISRFIVTRYFGGTPDAEAGAAVENLVEYFRRRQSRVVDDATERDETDEMETAVGLRLAAMLLNNDFQSTRNCVEFLRNFAAPTNTHYVSRGFRQPAPPELLSAVVTVWAPEEDTSVYYSRLRPLTFGLASDDAVSKGEPRMPRLAPPSGVDAGVFFELVESRRRGFGENLLTIDKAANNTSIVFLLEWKGWRLLFPGDAEEKSWKIMAKHGFLDAPIDFLKIGHHGSHNGTPEPAVLDRVFPRDGLARYAAVCTCAGVYDYSDETAIPNTKTLRELADRCTVCSVQSLPEGGHLDLIFPPDRQGKVVLKPDGIVHQPAS
jgi:hypothetical protein